MVGNVKGGTKPGSGLRLWCPAMASTDSTSQPAGPLFPKLKRGPRKISAEEAGRHQRSRLEKAMVEAVARHGYEATTLGELVTLAGVSKSTFYASFATKEECFLSAFDQIIGEATERVSEAYRGPGDFRERLLAALRSFMDLVLEAPAAASLAGVESLTLGAAGVAHRDRGSAAFEVMIRQSFEHSPSKIEVPDLIVRAIVGGIRGVVYHRLRSGETRELPGLVPELVDWALCYQRPPSAAMLAAAEAASRPTEVVPPDAGGRPVPWSESPASKRSRARLTPRERIARAAARVVVSRGYGALSIPAISAEARTSNQTFYEHFDSKRAAFLAAFEIYSGAALRYSAAAFAAEGDKPEAVGAGLRGLVDFVTEHEHFAQLAFFELPTAGPVALDTADETLEAFMAYLRPGIAPSGIGGPVSEVVMEAIATGTWAVLQHEIAQGRRAELSEIAPQLTTIALAPFAV
jgi:AcrR family transcriptional regulator